MVVSGFKEDGGMSSTATIDPGGQTSSPLRDRLLVAWSAAGAILPCLLPNTGPAILGLSVAAPLILADPVSLNRNLRQVSPVLAFTIACVLYLCVNLLLAPMIDNAVGAVVTIALAAGACHLCAAAFPILRIRDLKLMALGLFMGCLLMAGFLFFEYMTRMSLLRGLQRLTEKAKLPFIRVEAGTWEAPFYPYMSRNLVVLIMLSWAAVAFAWATCGRNIRRIVVPAFLLLVLASAMLSPSATAKVGFIAGAAAFVAVSYAPRATGLVIAGLWTITSLGCIPIAHLIHALRLYEIDWINASLRHRMMIWSVSADWFWQHPILGLGIGGARKVNLNHDLSLTAKGIEGEPLNWHAHNIFVQAWFETGIIGGVLLCLLGLLVLRAIFRLPPDACRYAVATFVSIFIIGLTGFSLWASWYLAGYGLATLCILLTAFINRDGAALQETAAG